MNPGPCFVCDLTYPKDNAQESKHVSNYNTGFTRIKNTIT